MEDSRFEWLARALGAVTAHTANSTKAGNAAIRLADSLTLTRGTTPEDDPAPWAQAAQAPPRHLSAVPPLPPAGTELSDEFMEQMDKAATDRALARNAPGSAERFSYATRARR
jgi:hypothetical protein